MKKKLLVSLVVSSMLFGLSITAMAAENVDSHATDEFSNALPDKQGAVEASTVRKGTNTQDFYITVDSVSGGTSTDSVCVWGESPSGNNYSNPSKQMTENTSKTIYYYDSPAPSSGDNVTLNLANPIKTTSNPTASGTWNAK